MIVYPNAKINIGLRITEKRSDGFHNISSLFYPIPISDIIEFNEFDGVDTALNVTGADFSIEKQKNIVYKTWLLMHEKYSIPMLNIHLHKLIPSGAGLGGGSADATFFALAIRDYFKLKASNNDIEKLVSTLGSDCPFFIHNTPMIVEGTGNAFSNTNVSLKGKTLVLINPGINISTADAFSGITPNRNIKPLESIIEKPISEWKRSLVNDFENHIFKAHPEIEKLKQDMYNTGAIYASMSGSGSSVYGIYDSTPEDLVINKLYFSRSVVLQ